MFSTPKTEHVAESGRLAADAFANRDTTGHHLGQVVSRHKMEGARDEYRFGQAIAHNLERASGAEDLADGVRAHVSLQDRAMAVLSIVRGYETRIDVKDEHRVEASRIANRPEIVAETMLQAEGRFQDMSEFGQRALAKEVAATKADMVEYRELRQWNDEALAKQDDGLEAEYARMFNQDRRAERGEVRPDGALNDREFREMMIEVGSRAVAMATWPRQEAAEWFGHADANAVKAGKVEPAIPFERGERERVIVQWLIDEQRRDPKFNDAYDARVVQWDTERDKQIEAERLEGRYDRDPQDTHARQQAGRALLNGREALAADGIPHDMQSRQRPQAVLPREFAVTSETVRTGLKAMARDLGVTKEDVVVTGDAPTVRNLAAELLHYTLPLVDKHMRGHVGLKSEDFDHGATASKVSKSLFRGQLEPYEQGMAAVESLSRWAKISPEAQALFKPAGMGESWARAASRDIKSMADSARYVMEVLEGPGKAVAELPKIDSPSRRAATMRQVAMARASMTLVR